MADTLEKKLNRLASKQYLNWQEKREHETGAFNKPDEWIWFKHPTHSDYYNKFMLEKFVNAAKKYKIDPYDFIGLGISETGLGNLEPSIEKKESPNPLHINLSVHWGQIADMINKGIYPNKKSALLDIMIDYGAKYLKEQLDKYPDKESAIQAYSGTGRTIYGGKPLGWGWAGDTPTGPIQDLDKKYPLYFGKPFKEIDFWKEKPQAKRVLDISSKLKKQPEFVDLIKELATIAD